MIDIRCKSCNKILAKAVVFVGAVKCPRCKMIFEYREYEEIYQTSTYSKNYELQIKERYVINEQETTESELLNPSSDYT